MNTTIKKKWFVLAFLCWMPVFSQVVSNGYLLEKTTGIPNAISESPVPARVASSADRLAFLYLGSSKEPRISVKNQSGEFSEVKNVPTCLIQPLAQSYVRGHYVVSSEGIYGGCQNLDTTKYFSILRTGADWSSFTEVLKTGTEFNYLQPASGFSGRGTLKEVLSGMWPGGYTLMSVTDNNRENLGMFQLSGNTWKQVMPPQANISPMGGSPIWSEDGVNIYFLSFQVENRGYVVMRWNSSSKTLVKELTESQVGANPSSFRLLLVNDNKSLLLRYTVGSEASDRLITIPGKEKILDPSSYDGSYWKAGQVSELEGFSTKLTTTDTYDTGLATCQDKQCKTAVEAKSLGENSAIGMSWVENGIFSFYTVNRSSVKVDSWYKLLWPKVAKATQEQSKLVVEGSGFDLGSKVEVRIRDRRLTPTSTTTTRLEVSIPQDPYFYGENLPLQVFVLHQAGELKSWERTVSLTAPRPTAKISFKPVDPEKTRVFPGDLVEITWETEATEVVFLNGEEKSDKKGTMLMTMTASMDFEVVAYGPGGEAKDKVRVVVSLPPPVIEDVKVKFDQESNLTAFEITGQYLASTTLQVRVELANGKVVQELSVSSANSEKLEAYVSGILKPGTYVVTVVRPPEEGDTTEEEKSNPITVTIPEPDAGSQTAKPALKGGRN